MDNVEERRLKQNQQLLREQYILSDQQQCVNYPNRFSTTMIDEYHWQTVFEGSKYEFFNYDFMKWLACSLQGSFTLPNNVIRLANIENVKETIHSLTQVGEESVSGIVFDPEFDGVMSGVLIKTPRNEDADTELFHEFFIGSYLNTLRSSIPNFMFVFGLFRCDMPMLSSPDEVYEPEQMEVDDVEAEMETKNSKPEQMEVDDVEEEVETKNSEPRTSDTFCRKIGGADVTNYLMIERIGDGLSLGKAVIQDIQEGKRTRILGWIVQVVAALHIAYHEYDFTHYDLHTGNVLIRDISDAIPPPVPQTLHPKKDSNHVYIHYFQWGLDFRVKTESVATIIDYGASHVKDHLGNDYGSYRLSDRDNRSNPAADLYRFIGWIVFNSIIAMDEIEIYWIDLMRFFQIKVLREQLTENGGGIQPMNFNLEDVFLGELSDVELVKFILEEDGSHFNIADRWPEMNKKEGKDRIYLDFLDFLKMIYSDEWTKVVTNVWTKDMADLNCSSFDCSFSSNLMKR